MINHYLFEIECAEAVGAYRVADQLSQQLIRVATADEPKSIVKKLKKIFANNKKVKDVSYSPTLQKFIIALDNSIGNGTKRQIASLVEPYKVGFKYSQKQPSFMDIFDEEMSPEERALRDVLEGKEEPDEDDLILEKDVDPLSDDELSLDSLLLEEAHDDVFVQDARRRLFKEIGLLPKDHHDL